MASTKRAHSETQQEPELKKSKKELSESDAVLERDFVRVGLNPADCNLDFNVEDNGLAGNALYAGGFAYCWSGARANYGITGGKYCFSCKIIAEQPVEMEETPRDQQHLCRIGISRGDDPVGNLGETPHSYGFGGTAKFSNAGKFSDYGETFGLGDQILCAVDLEAKPQSSIRFFKNGISLGVAKHFDAGHDGLKIIGSQAGEMQLESALFPHILLKNVHVQMQFSDDDGLIPPQGYKPWKAAVWDINAIHGPRFNDLTECEVIMMVGLPGSGKSTWAEKWVREHPEKRYILLGTNLALDQMKVPGLLRKNNYGERFDRLMDRAIRIFNTLLSRAAKVPRNYIIDQTNVYKSARRRKLKPFAFFHKIAVVIVTSPEELKTRAEKRFKEMGKEVPPEAVNEMLANFVLPMSKDMRGTDEYFDEVIFPDLDRDKAQICLDQMKRAIGIAGPKSDKSPGSQISFPGSGWQGPPGHQTQLSDDCRPPPPPHLASDYRGPAELGRMESFTGLYQANVNACPGRDSSFVSNQWHNYQNNLSGGMIDPGLRSDAYQMYASGDPGIRPHVGNQNIAPPGAVNYYRRFDGPYAPPSNALPYGVNPGLPQANIGPPTESAYQQMPLSGFGSSYGISNARPPGNLYGHMQDYRGTYRDPPPPT